MLNNPDFSDVFRNIDDVTTSKLESPTQNHSYSHESAGQQEQGGHVDKQGTNAVFDKLLANYDKAIKIPPPERIGIFVRKYINILAGQAGVGKSWQVIRWTRDLSTGGFCFGGVVENEPPRKVLVIAGELPKSEMERRCRLLEEGDGRERNYDNFAIVDVKEAEAAKMSLMLDTEDGKKNIESLIAYRKPDIVFFDSFVSLFSGDEKDSKDVNGAMKFLERIADKYSTAAVLIHHVRKRLSREQGRPITQDDVIGSSIFNRRSGFIFATERVDYAPDGFHSKKITLVKEVKSWLQSVKAYAFEVKSGFYGQGVVMDITPSIEDEQVSAIEGNLGARTTNTKTPTDSETLILTFLRGKGADGATPKDINKGIGRNNEEYNKTTMQLTRLKDDGKVIQPKRGIYTLPDYATQESENESQPDEAQVDFDFEIENNMLN